MEDLIAQSTARLDFLRQWRALKRPTESVPCARLQPTSLKTARNALRVRSEASVQRIRPITPHAQVNARRDFSRPLHAQIRPTGSAPNATKIHTAWEELTLTHVPLHARQLHLKQCHARPRQIGNVWHVQMVFSVLEEHTLMVAPLSVRQAHMNPRRAQTRPTEFAQHVHRVHTVMEGLITLYAPKSVLQGHTRPRHARP